MQLIAPPVLIVIDINSLYTQEENIMEFFLIPEPARTALEFGYFNSEDGQQYEGNASKCWSRIRATKLDIEFTDNGSYKDHLRNTEMLYSLIAKYWNIQFEIVASIYTFPLDFEWKITGTDGSIITITPDNLV